MSIAPVAMRQKIEALRSYALSKPKAHIRVEYAISPETIAKTILIPKGTLLVGHVSRFENINVIFHGDISVSTDSGMRRLQAGAIVPGSAGKKRVGYAHEDTIWTTIFPNKTKETNIEKMDELLIVESFSQEDALGLELKEFLKLKD